MVVSDWIRCFSHLLPEGGSVLDLAAGGGRHCRWFLQRGCQVTAVDRDVEALRGLKETVPQVKAGLEIIEVDLENGSPWPLEGRQFDGVIVVNYLWRPLFPSILNALNPGGILLYETFAEGHEALGRPRNPDFLLAPGELLQVVQPRLTVAAYQHGRFEGAEGPAIKQRIAAISSTQPAALDPPTW
ncbi:MAG: class I SAM-dependent methyltransferase [Geminicoccaceae bacterium]